jgi:GAF domain-containing protein
MASPVPQADPFAELGRIVLSEDSLESILDRVTTLARQLVPGADEVSVTLVQAGKASTAAYTGELALSLDKTQYAQGDGPCLTAASDREVVAVPDLSTEERWPEFTAAARERGVGSMLSIGLPVREQVIGALNMYARVPGAFDDHSVEMAETFAGHAAVALANATLYASATSLAEQMAEAMRSRAVIEQAKGILMAQRHCTPDDAFELLTQASQRANKKLRDIAAAIVEHTIKDN